MSDPADHIEGMNTTMDSQLDEEKSLQRSPVIGVKSPMVFTPTASESYENLKANLIIRDTENTTRVLLFTATSPGEGTSTTAINFANTLAQSSHCRVLLIDASLRTPDLEDELGNELSLKTSEEDSEDDGGFRIKKIGPGNLHILTFNGSPFEPLSFLKTDCFENFLKQQKENFDFVILDAPPVNRFSDSRILCSKVDGVVLVIESGKTRKHVALRAKKQLIDAGANIIGVVLNKRKYYIPDFIYRFL